MGGFFVGKEENMKKNKTLGIIGGLGPETTARFYMEVVFACSKISGKRPQILISNVAVPLSVEKELITEAKNMISILPFLLSAAKQLEEGGADFIVIPCNTVHIFIEEIRKSINIPVLSIIEEASSFLSREKIKEVGVLATTATIENKLFDKHLRENGIRMIIPAESNQSKMGAIINHLVNNQQTQGDRDRFQMIIDETETENVILACTDLQILEPKIDGIRIFDTMDILTKSAVREIFK
jgi:aspartate racemase